MIPKELFASVEEMYVFDEDSYPELSGKSNEEVGVFAIKHCLLHISKNAGVLAGTLRRAKLRGFSEEEDEKLKEVLAKILMNMMRIISVIDFGGMQVAKQEQNIPFFNTEDAFLDLVKNVGQTADWCESSDHSKFPTKDQSILKVSMFGILHSVFAIISFHKISTREVWDKIPKILDREVLV